MGQRTDDVQLFKLGADLGLSLEAQKVLQYTGLAYHLSVAPVMIFASSAPCRRQISHENPITSDSPAALIC